MERRAESVGESSSLVEVIRAGLTQRPSGEVTWHDGWGLLFLSACPLALQPQLPSVPLPDSMMPDSWSTLHFLVSRAFAPAVPST